MNKNHNNYTLSLLCSNKNGLITDKCSLSLLNQLLVSTKIYKFKIQSTFMGYNFGKLFISFAFYNNLDRFGTYIHYVELFGSYFTFELTSCYFYSLKLYIFMEWIVCFSIRSWRDKFRTENCSLNNKNKT